MGFPKKRISNSPVLSSSSREEHSRSPSGLDLLSAAIDSSRLPQHASAAAPEPAASASRSGSEGTIVTTSSAGGDCASDGEASGTSNSKPKSEASSGSQKRARTFPEILMDILSDPDHSSIVGWLPHGKSFAIHDPAKFSSVILPKYFRRVIFRSFIRKLNRWGFRSVKRSVSGFESTFEHKSFLRDEPDMVARMYCKSNPSCRAVPKNKNPQPSAAELPASAPAVPSDEFAPQQQHIITPSSSISSAAMLHQLPAAHHLPQPPLATDHHRGHLPSHLSHNEEFRVQLSNEIMLRELQMQRQRALVESLVHQVPASEADVVSQYVAEKWQQMLMAQQHQPEHEYRRLSGL